jgi:ankyrin repeat protein
MDSLSTKKTLKAIRKALKTLPEDLDSTYEEAMQRVESQCREDRKLAEKIFLWISFAKRPLMAIELQEALGVEIGQSRFDEENVPDEALLTSVCAGLVIIDESSGIIRLVHYTTQEYFQRVGSTRFPSAHREIALACLTYLCFDDFEEGPCTNDDEMYGRLTRFPLLRYAARYWGRHAQMSLDLELQRSILRFLRDKHKLLSSMQAGRARCSHIGYSQDFPREVTPLHGAALFGLNTTLNSLFDEGFDISAQNSFGETALHLAAAFGYEDCVRNLLEHGAPLHTKNLEGLTALHKAAFFHGNEAIMLLLLSKGARISESVDGRTALHFAAEFGSEAMVSILIAKGADVKAKSIPWGSKMNQKFCGGRTPLHWAAESGNEGLVQVLLDNGADVNAVNLTLRTALQEACMLGHNAVVRILLENGASVQSQDEEGWTPLHEAAYWGHVEIAELLLSQRHNADVNTKISRRPDDAWHHLPLTLGGRSTPLHFAASQGRSRLCELLISNGANITTMDDNGVMAIHMAAFGGSASTLKVFLDMGIAVDTRDCQEDTPLHKAASFGRIECVLLLLHRGADIDAVNVYGARPIDLTRKSSRTYFVLKGAPSSTVCPH